MTRHIDALGDGASCRPIDDDVWELYGPDDWTQAHDLAAEQPEKLAHLQRLFLIEAAKYNVLPLDDRRVERFNPDLAGRPQLIHGNRQILFGGMGRLSENSVIVLKNKSHAITAEVAVPDGGADGVIVAQGGAFGGLDAVRPRRPARLLLQPVRAAALQGRTAPTRSRRGRTRSGSSSPTTVAGWARAATVALFVDGSRSARAGWTPPCRCCSRPTRRRDVGSDTGDAGDGRPRRGRDRVHGPRALGRDRYRRRRRGRSTTSSHRRSATGSRWRASSHRAGSFDPGPVSRP